MPTIFPYCASLLRPYTVPVSSKNLECVAEAHSSPFLALRTLPLPLQVARCAKWLQEGCYDTFDKINCAAAFQFCSEFMVLPFNTTGECSFQTCAQHCALILDCLVRHQSLQYGSAMVRGSLLPSNGLQLINNAHSDGTIEKLCTRIPEFVSPSIATYSIA